MMRTSAGNEVMAMPAHALLNRIAEQYRAVLGSKLTGVYVHGSLAFGCFSWATGDIDFLAAAEAPLTQEEKEALIRVLLDMTPEAPPKGFEMSVVLRKDCNPVVHPVPFELHFSNAHKSRAEVDLSAYCGDMHGTDPDLAAHFTVVRAVGRAIYGLPVEEVFGDVPRSAYVDSILSDVDNAEAEIADNPVYITLNLCRVLAYLSDGLVLSKQQGGQWGMQHLPAAYHPLLRAAMAAYAGAENLEFPSQAAFAADMLRRIRALV